MLKTRTVHSLLGLEVALPYPQVTLTEFPAKDLKKIAGMRGRGGGRY